MDSSSEPELSDEENKIVYFNVSENPSKLTFSTNDIKVSSRAEAMNILEGCKMSILVILFSNSFKSLLSENNNNTITSMRNYFEKYNASSSKYKERAIPRIIYTTENFVDEIGANTTSDILEYVSCIADVSILIKASLNVFHSQILSSYKHSFVVKRFDIPAKSPSDVEYTLHIPGLFKSRKDYTPYKYVKDLEVLLASLGSLYRDVTVIPDQAYYTLCSFNFSHYIENGLYFPIEKIWNNPSSYSLDDNIITPSFPILKGFAVCNAVSEHEDILRELGAEIASENRGMVLDLSSSSNKAAFKLACISKDAMTILRLFSKKTLFMFYNEKKALTSSIYLNKCIQKALIRLNEPASMKKYPILFLADGEISLDMINFIVDNSDSKLAIFSKRIASIMDSYDIRTPLISNIYYPLIRRTSANIEVIFSLFRQFCNKNNIEEIRLPIMETVERDLITKTLNGIGFKTSDEEYENLELVAGNNIMKVDASFIDAIIESFLPATRKNLCMIVDDPIILESVTALDITYFMF